ncbi:MAG: hypothetical protein U9N18_04795 [Campylobacterota bacterium]|nr:hypothetical protein [Campylobacterota bacterium]
MTVNQSETYKAELHRALEKCQFVEETLKMCLLSAIDIARIQVQPFFPLKLKSEDISRLPLGPLAKAFAKILVCPRQSLEQGEACRETR